MTTKIALEARRLKLKTLIAKGLQPQEVMQELGIRRRTFYTDLAAIQKEGFDETQKNYSLVKMLAMRDELLRGLMLKRVSARSDADFVKASMAANQCLSELIRDLARLGILPKDDFEYQSPEEKGYVNLTLLKQHALAALEREEQNKKREEEERLFEEAAKARSDTQEQPSQPKKEPESVNNTGGCLF